MHIRALRVVRRWLALLARPALRGRYSLLLIVVLGTLAACSGITTSSPAARATATARAGTTATAAALATRAAEPVLFAVQVAQQGTVAAGNAKLAVTFTVTNQTTKTIHLTAAVCHQPSRVFEFEVDQGKQTLWASWGYVVCIQTKYPVYDVQAVAAGSTYTATITGNLAQATQSGVPQLQAGIAYTVKCTAVFWHQGTIAQYDQPGILSGNPTVNLPLTLR